MSFPHTSLDSSTQHGGPNEGWLEQPENFTPRMFVQGDRAWVRDYRPTAGKWQQGIVQSCMGSLHYNVELEGSHQRKLHVDHLICQSPGCVLASSEPVPVLTDDELSLEPESGMGPPSDSSRPQLLNTSELSEFDTVNSYTTGTTDMSSITSDHSSTRETH